MSEKKISDEIVMESAACPNGCNVGDKIILRGRDTLHSIGGDYFVVKCLACGLMRTDPRPDFNSIGKFYPENYAPYKNLSFKKSKKTGILKTIVDFIFRFNDNLLPLSPPGKLLEVGCASGVYLNDRLLDGWQVEGVEFSESAVNVAREHGMRVHHGQIKDIQLENAPYDIVVAQMVLEHLYNPVAELKEWRKLIKPGGKLVISVPNINSLDFYLFKQYWYGLQLPTHLFHFTPQTLTNVLLNSGWRVVRISHQRTLASYIGSLGIYLEQRTRFSRTGRYLKDLTASGGYLPYLIYPLSLSMAALGQTGRMTIWAEPLDD